MSLKQSIESLVNTEIKLLSHQPKSNILIVGQRLERTL